MVVLGINGGLRLGYQDVSAVLIIDGKVIAAVEEERLNRIKHSPGQLPYLSIKEVLKIGKIKFSDINIIATHGSTWGEEYRGRLKDYLKFTFGSSPEIRSYHHHDCHAASAFYASGFDETMIVTADSSGDGVALQLATGKGNVLEVLKRVERPDSLGLFYSMITQFCGFGRDSDEYKLMGLSSYGNSSHFDFNEVISYENGALKLNRNFIPAIEPGKPQPTRQEKIFNDSFIGRYGEHRVPGAPVNQHFMDVAASAQKHLEDMLVGIVTDLNRQTGLTKLCMAGGVALNCAANQKLANLPFMQDIYIAPASSDAGISLGAAYLATNEEGIKCTALTDTYLGPSFTNDEIKSVLEKSNTRFSFCSNPVAEAAMLLEEGKVIGWFQDRMEFGPRALGNRSILANPATPDIQNTVNQKIKFREGFRPFCPSVLEEDVDLFFRGRPFQSPNMTINYRAVETAKQAIPGVIHVDNTARIQTVSGKNNALYYDLLLHFKKSTGIGVLLNTSFNRNNEPMVCNPIEALSVFFGSGLDCLVMGDFVIRKD
jgi:carbamoyltransferase